MYVFCFGVWLTIGMKPLASNKLNFILDRDEIFRGGCDKKNKSLQLVRT